MIRKCTSLVIIGLLGVVGCNSKDTPGGDTNQKPPMVGHAPGTFTLSASSISLKQGESKVVPISIDRGKNFEEDVTLKFDGLPDGVSVDPGSAVIKKGDKDTHVTIKATSSAALGGHDVKLVGHPTKGADTGHPLKITVSEDPNVKAAASAAASREAYIAEKSKQLQDLDAKYEGLKTQAAKSEGQTKKDLEKKAEDVKVKRDQAATKLEDLKKAPLDKWESLKDSVGTAFDDFGKMFQ